MRSPGQTSRLERVLDSAAELLVRWGYQRVTIDEVARHAGIGKGTVYLHFRTKDALFLTVLLRAHRRTRRRIARPDARPTRPTRCRPGCAARPTSTWWPTRCPAALYLGDGEVLGRLAHEAADTLGELAETAGPGVRSSTSGCCATAGCLRVDLDVDAQLYLVTAIVTGFFFVDGAAAPDLVIPRVRADAARARDRRRTAGAGPAGRRAASGSHRRSRSATDR